MPKNDEFDELTAASVISGEGTTETISGTGPSLQFSGSDTRDIHTSTDVTLSNSTGASVTEDVTCDFYEGVDATGTLVTSETQSVTVEDTLSQTVTYLTDEHPLGTGDYYIEVTTTNLTVDGIDEHTSDAQFTTTQSSEGDLVKTDQNGRERIRFGAMGATHLPLVADPTNDRDVTPRTWVEDQVSGVDQSLADHSSATTDIHGVGTSTIASASDIDSTVESHRLTGVHNTAQPPEAHDNTTHTETYAVDGTAQPPENHGNEAHTATFAVDGDAQPPEVHDSTAHSEDYAAATHDHDGETLGDVTATLLTVQQQDLSTVTTPSSGPIYHHDGASEITADGAATTAVGYYVWSGTDSEWKAIVQY